MWLPKVNTSGPSLCPKWLQNGSKKAPKWVPKWLRNGSQKWSGCSLMRLPKVNTSGLSLCPKWFQNRSRREPKLVQHGTQTGSQNGCPTVTVTRIARTRTHSHAAHRGHVGMGAQMVWKWFPKVVKVFTYAAAKSERFRALALCKMVPKWS